MFKALLVLALVIGSNALLSVNFTSPIVVRPGDAVFHGNNYFSKNKKKLPTRNDTLHPIFVLQNDGVMYLSSSEDMKNSEPFEKGYGYRAVFNSTMRITIKCIGPYYGRGEYIRWWKASETTSSIQIGSVRLSTVPLHQITNHCFVPN